MTGRRPTDPSWQRTDALLDELLALDEDARRVRLHALAVEDPDLAANLERLLAHAGDDHCIDEVLLSALDHLAGEDSVAPRRLGPWQLASRIGYGGMSQVFLAERADGSYRHQVAIKLIWPGLTRPEMLARFQRERQILAALDDARIARLIDGGITGDGRPWLAMEYVEGMAVDDWCDHHRLDLTARLRLFADIVAAVSAAHRQLVVHRDIKPANVLVRADGEIKLLDFGIARLLGDAADESAATRLGERVFTPEYASPEQITGSPVTTASDVYQLGALLFQLLTGAPPHRRSGLSQAEFEAGVLDDRPRLASAAIRALDRADAADIARRRQSTPAGLVRGLRGDLDAIIACAMALDPQARYASADALGQDVRRVLQSLPVVARPPRRLYRAGKFVRRHWAGVAGAALVVLAVLAGLAGTSYQARIAATEATKAREVRQFLVDLFEVSAPDVAQGQAFTVREMLDRGAVRIRGELAGQPEIQADLLATVGDIYRRLGMGEDAEELLDTALEMRLYLHGPDHPAVAEVKHYLGQLYAHQGHAERAEAFLAEARDIRVRHLGPTDPAVADTLLALIQVLWRGGRLDEAEPLARRSLEIYRQSLPAHDPRVNRALRALATMQHSRGNLDEAEAIYRRIVTVMRSRYGDVHSEIASALHNLGFIESARGHHAQAEALLRESLAIKLQIYGEGHPELVTTVAAIGRERERQGDLDGALRQYTEGLAMLRHHVAPDNPRIASALQSIANVLIAQDREAEAVAYLDESLGIRREVLGAGHHLTQGVGNQLADLLITLGDLDGAGRVLDQTATPDTAEHYAATRSRLQQALAARQSNVAVR